MNRRDYTFCAFILSHGRADNVRTYDTIRNAGFTGRIIIVIDNEDDTAEDYYKNFGKENVVMFDKLAMSKTFETADNFESRKTIVYARNACFDIAKSMGIDYFIQLDDDYTWFGHRTAEKSKKTKSLDKMFHSLVKFLVNSKILTVAFSQGGDHIGGYNPDNHTKRKAMNSFIFSSKSDFRFVGRINEDVNSYVYLGSLGYIFLTILNIQLTQIASQSNSSGMTDIYLASGTYVKSFYSVIFAPSCVKIKMMGSSSQRLHHNIKWENAVPKIISEDYKK